MLLSVYTPLVHVYRNKHVREFYGAILPFRNENQYSFCILNQNYSEKKVFGYVINRL